MIAQAVLARIDQKLKACLLLVKFKRKALGSRAAELKAADVAKSVLISKEHVGINAQIVADLGKGIHVKAQAVGKLGPDFFDIIGNDIVLQPAINRIGAHEH